MPERVVADMAKTRRRGKVLIDGSPCMVEAVVRQTHSSNALATIVTSIGARLLVLVNQVTRFFHA